MLRMLCLRASQARVLRVNSHLRKATKLSSEVEPHQMDLSREPQASLAAVSSSVQAL